MGAGLAKRIIKQQKEWIEEIVNAGWFYWEDDQETYFLKHAFKTADRKTLCQIISSPSIGTGVYVMKTSRNSMKVSRVPYKNSWVFKIDCYNVDGMMLPDGTALMEEELGKERFIQELLRTGLISKEELIYFSPSEFERRRIRHLHNTPPIILHIQ